mgnify:CR=1 FL=1
MSEETKERTTTKEPVDVVNQFTGEEWYYSDIVKEHFFNPRNLLLEDPVEGEYNAIGKVGSPACGDMMFMWLKIDPKTEQIKELKWRTFGCASAIAATSMFSVMVAENDGMPISEALAIRPQHIMERLGGLPNRKIHCSENWHSVYWNIHAARLHVSPRTCKEHLPSASRAIEF